MNRNSEIIILDYNIGNLTSILNMLKRIGVSGRISNERESVANASKFILPGVGSFDYGINSLKGASYFSILEEKVLIDKTPILGVCLGAQLLTNFSEEGSMPGLGWIPGKVVKFDKESMVNKALKIPHMGWSEVNLCRQSRLFTDMLKDPRFYFVHSYHIVCENHNDVFLTSRYGYDFSAGIEKDNIIGVQFHPEKSHKYGMKLYENFVNYY